MFLNVFAGNFGKLKTRATYVEKLIFANFHSVPNYKTLFENGEMILFERACLRCQSRFLIEKIKK